MRIVFMGTPEFAVPTLEILLNSGYNIVGVITSPDKMGGRGRKQLIESAVKKFAQSRELNILQPTNLKSEKFQNELRALNADLQIVVAFRMLPESVWNMPPLGTYNLHGSLLPAYRGAAPINWAVIKGETITGVTSFKLKHEIDTGSVLLQKKMPIYETDTATDLHDRMMYLAADVVLESVRKIEKDEIHLIEQDPAQVSHAPKLNKENTRIVFNNAVNDVYNFIRGLSQHPGAWFNMEGAVVKVYDCEKLIENHEFAPGTVSCDGKSVLLISCTDGFIKINKIKYPGKRMMAINEFLNGFEVPENLKLD